MASRPFARFLLIFTALLLPLQAMAAAGMAFSSRHDAAPAVLDAASEECHHHDAAAAAADQADEQDCDQCGICHLACSGYMPASGMTTGMAPFGHVYRASPLEARPSHIPEPPTTPPRRSA